MTERTYRFVLGAILVILLYFRLEPLQYAYVGMLLFEGLTGYRLTTTLARLRRDAIRVERYSYPGEVRFTFEAERGMRLGFAGIMIATLFLIPEEYWFINWLVAIALFLSGLVNFCPMVATLRWLGLR
jgi:hypothetical protein